jgi:prophage antirepressor-like protein
VFEEVLPSIRKTGSYGRTALVLTRGQKLAEAVLMSAEMLTEKDHIIPVKDTQIAMMAPKVEALERPPACAVVWWKRPAVRNMPCFLISK